MDEADYAQQNEELFRRVALERHKARRNRNAKADIGGHDCIMSPNICANLGCGDCGSPIAAARLKANPQAVRCVGCQTEFERRSGRG